MTQLQILGRAAFVAVAVILPSGCGGSSGTDAPIPDALSVVSGNIQTGIAGSSLPDSLVILATTGGAAVQGANVSWVVASGNASLSPQTSVTDGAGHAATRVTLGSTAGAVTIRADVAGGPSATFSLTSVSACSYRAPYTLGTSVNNALGAPDCLFFLDQSFIDYYQLTLATQQAARFTMTSATFDTFIFLFDAALVPFAANDDDALSTNSDLAVILAPGTYVVGANSYAPGMTGPYTLSSFAVPEDIANCAVWYLTPSLQLTQQLAATDCVGTAVAGAYADLMAILVPAGGTITITQTSAAFDAFLALYSGGTPVASDNNGAGGTNARIVYTSPAEALLVLEASSAGAAAVGAYSLTISGLTAGAAAAAVGRSPAITRRLPESWSNLVPGGFSRAPRAGPVKSSP